MRTILIFLQKDPKKDGICAAARNISLITCGGSRKISLRKAHGSRRFAVLPYLRRRGSRQAPSANTTAHPAAGREMSEPQPPLPPAAVVSTAVLS